NLSTCRRRPGKYCNEDEQGHEKGEGDLSRNNTQVQVRESEENGRESLKKKQHPLPCLPRLPEFSFANDASSDTDCESHARVPSNTQPDEPTSSSTATHFPSFQTPIKRSITSNYTNPRVPNKTTIRPSPSMMRDAGNVTLPIDPLERDRILFSTLLTIKAMVRNNSIAIQRLSEQADKNRSQGEVEESIDNFGFPFQTMDQVRQVENILEDKTKFKLLVRKKHIFKEHK
ncbi:uncharacterized protein LOC124271575, partial [Haliotis rubra]|uniref:uncharacterized protein LOC124271575 n=1 Tax=Haliotis rubra TaxID=36100 RepID=UPI001EE5DB57